MNKKLLFAAMSFAALTACSTDDFESQQQVAEGVSPIQFEVINNDGDITRASMDGNTIKWNANDGDLFTLYHGATAPTATGAQPATGSFSNAIYTAQAGAAGEVASLSTPSMINQGAAIMVWPVDTTSFSVTGANLSVKIPANQDNIEKYIPYVSDLVEIKPRVATGTPTYPLGADNTAGYSRKYPVFMRPMASQLTLKADYAGTDATLNALATGADPIEPIKVTSVELETSATGSTKFTTTIPVVFTDTATINTNNSLTAGTTGIKAQWNKAAKNNNWTHVASFGTASASVAKLTTTCLTGNESSKFLILPQAQMTTTGQGVAGAAVTVNTIYGKVVVGQTAQGGSYTNAEIGDAWYRYVSATTTVGDGETKATSAESAGDNAGKFKTYANVSMGMKQTLNGFSKYTATTGAAKYEPVGASATRYVKVLLGYLNMDGLHITNDKHLYDAVRVWKEIGKGDVTVLLDGDDSKNFEISQKTIAKINEINAATAKETPARTFTVMPCNTHTCDIIVITGGGEMPQDLSFIQKGAKNSNKTASVALKAGETWKWATSTIENKKAFKVDATATGILKIINKGTLTSDATATLAIYDNAASTAQVTNIEFVNDGKWDITAGTLNVQFDVTNNGIVNIAKGAQYRQDGSGNVFTNDATTLPERFFMNDPTKSAADKKAFKESIGVVNNKGVFATVNNANINNYGLIEHADKDAKTYITSQKNGAGFGTPWATSNKLGRINLPYSNKDEDNISINAAASEGFVSVTVTSDNAPSDKKLDVSTVGAYVNYLIINSGVEQITNVNNQVKYVEVNDENNTEIAWMPRFNKTTGAPIPYSYTGLIVLSDVNIKLNTIVTVTGSTYIASDMYVGGTFTPTTYNGYFGNTTTNSATMYITY